MCNFKTRLEALCSPKSQFEWMLSEVSFAGRQSALKKQTKQTKGKITIFGTTYHPGVKRPVKRILMQKWNLVQNQPMLKTICKTPPIISYKKVNRSKTCSSEQNFRGFCAATTKPHRGVCWPVYDIFNHCWWTREATGWQPPGQEIPNTAVCTITDLRAAASSKALKG